MDPKQLQIRAARFLASLAACDGDHDGAIRHLISLLETDPSAAEPFLELARASAEAGRHGEARRYFRIYLDRTDELNGHAATFPGPGGFAGAP